MALFRSIPWCRILALFCAGLCIVLPALAVNGTITMGYRGSGGYYFGDTVVFDGTNSAGNITVLKFTGTGLPPEGVPLTNPSGAPGTGNSAKVDERGYWKFTWDTSQIDDSKLFTGRYYFTAWDLEHPSVTATTSFVMKKPEFYLTATPQIARPGDYVELLGMAEKGVSYVKLNVSDGTGKVLHTFMAPVSATGSFQYGFHVDMTPGQYAVIGRNPAMKNDLKLTLTVSGVATNATATLAPTGEMTAETTTSGTVPAPAGTSSAPAGTQAGIGSGTLVIALAASVAALVLGRRN